MAHPQRRGAPVLFLDVDGVLNVATGADAFSGLHASLLDRLARVAVRTNARVVLSSSWRHDRQRLALLERAWRRAQLPPLAAATPTVPFTVSVARQRVLEIRQWLQANKSDNADCRWAVVDDLDLAAAADAADRFRFVRTDPRRGLSVDDVETLVGLLADASDEVSLPPPSSLRVPITTHLLQLAVDLIVVTTASHALVIDSADVSIVAQLDAAPSAPSLRAWLRAQEAEFSLDRIATITLDEGAADVFETSVAIRASSEHASPEAFAQSFVREASTTGNPSIEQLLEAIERRDLADWSDSDAASQHLCNAGFSRDVASALASGPPLVLSLLDVVPTLKPRSPERDALAIAICRGFPHAHDRLARRVLVEYVARGELTSIAAVEAVKLLWTTHDVNMEELDELLSVL